MSCEQNRTERCSGRDELRRTSRLGVSMRWIFWIRGFGCAAVGKCVIAATNTSTMRPFVIAVCVLLCAVVRTQASSCVGAQCCPCFCCGQTVNGRCDLMVAKPQCLNATAASSCAQTCFNMRGVDKAPCSLPWGAYSTQDCGSCLRSQPNFSLPTPSVVGSPSSLRGGDQQRKQPPSVTTANKASEATSSAGRVEGAARPVGDSESASSLPHSPKTYQGVMAGSPEACSYRCCGCQCCTKARNSFCEEFQQQNMCTVGDAGACAKVCADWQGADGQACNQGFPPVSYTVSDCGSCLN